MPGVRERGGTRKPERWRIAVAKTRFDGRAQVIENSTSLFVLPRVAKSDDFALEIAVATSPFVRRAT